MVCMCKFGSPTAPAVNIELLGRDSSLLFLTVLCDMEHDALSGGPFFLGN